MKLKRCLLAALFLISVLTPVLSFASDSNLTEPLTEAERFALGVSKSLVLAFMDEAKKDPLKEAQFRKDCKSQMEKDKVNDRLENEINAWTMLTCSRWMTEKKEFENGMALLNKVIALYGEDENKLLLRADLYQQMGDMKKTELEYSRAIQLFPDKLRPIYRRGRVYLMQGKLKEALADMDAAKRIMLALRKPDPASIFRDNPDVWSGRGAVLYRMNRFAEAADELTVALTIKLDSMEGLYYRAYSFYKLDRYDDALDDFDKYVSLIAPKAADMQFRGDVLYKLGRKEEAVQDYSKALSLDPAAFVIYYYRGVAHAELNRKGEAVSDLRLFIAKAQPADKLLAPAKKLLATLDGSKNSQK